MNEEEDYYLLAEHKYLRYTTTHFSKFIFSDILKFLDEGFEKKTACEIGAGMARFSHAVIEKFNKVYLIEPCGKFASILREQFKEYDVKIKEVTAEKFFEEKPELRNTVIFCFHLLHHLNYKQRKQLYSFIHSTGSEAVFVDPNPWNPLLLIQLMLHPDMKVKEEFRYLVLRKTKVFRELSEHGLVDLKYKRICFFPPFAANRILSSPLKKMLPAFEKINSWHPFFGSYHAIYCKSELGK